MTSPPPPWACVADATKLGGLTDLRRRYADQWHRVMRQHARDVDASGTVAEALRLGGNGLLLPKDPSDRAANNLKAPRSCAALLVREFGDVVLDNIDERWMREAREELAARGLPDRAMLVRAFTLLRKVAFRAQSRSGRRPDLAWKLPRKRRPALGERPERDVPHWDDVALCIAQARSARVRAAVALQGHMGVSPGVVLALRRGDLDEANQTVRAPVRGPGGRMARVPYPIPHDAWRAIALHLRGLPSGADALLFPKRGDPRAPCPSMSKAIRREARRLGFEAFSLAAVRRLAQAGLIELGARREQVRGSLWKGRSGRLPLSVRQLERQRRGWVEQRGAAVLPPTLRAPRDCAADEPERRFRRQNRPAEVLPDTPLARPERRRAVARRPPLPAPWMPPAGAAEYPEFGDLPLPELPRVATTSTTQPTIVQIWQPPPIDPASVYRRGAVDGAATTVALANGLRALLGEDEGST